MAICKAYGNPQLFITITANPKWDEIQQHLQQYENDKPNDRPDLECRVFKIKLDGLIAELKKGKYFGPTIAVVYTIEFQKRGLPHAHILVWLHETARNPTPAHIDEIISAEIPHKDNDPEAYRLVSQFMIHGPCEPGMPQTPCTKGQTQFSKGKQLNKGKGCTKDFPKPYNNETSIDKFGQVTYRRRNDQSKKVIKSNIEVGNSFVVPHNIALLKNYKAHINVEWCSGSQAIKYLFKYITKGVDKATISIEKRKNNTQNETTNSRRQQNRDEVQRFLECRYLSACEAAWRIFSFDIHYRKPAVQRLPLHLPDKQTVIYNETSNLGITLDREDLKRTMLTEWMETNKHNEEARALTYLEFPTRFVWNTKSKKWTERKRGHSLGRMVNIHPIAGETYYLRMLIMSAKGPTSYNDMLTVDGILHPNFKSACYVKGLLDGDSEWHDVMSEAGLWASAPQMRHLFVTILQYCEVGSSENLWNKCWKSMSEDILYNERKKLKFPQLELQEEQLKSYALMEIEKLLLESGKTLSDFPGMPQPDSNVVREMRNTLLMDESSYDVIQHTREHQSLITTLNDEQTMVFNAVMQSVDNKEGNLFFLYGAGGTGKTYLYKTIIARIRSQGKIVIPVASSGIAALLLPGGRTAHSRFKIPITITERSVCDIKHGSMLAELLQHADVIIWDEAPITHRHAFEAVDRTMRDLLSTTENGEATKPFGSKTVLLGGDFRQILPVVTNGKRQETILASINQSCLWESAEIYELKQNMRLHELERTFASWLLGVGDGRLNIPRSADDGNDEIEKISVESSIMLDNVNMPVEEISKYTYTNFSTSFQDRDYITQRAILTPTNETVDDINDYMLTLMPGTQTEYYSSDTIENEGKTTKNIEMLYPVEFLNGLKFSGLPNHKITLKIGVPIMLLRNLNKKEGLCNGTRLVVTRLGQRVIEAKILTGTHIGDDVIIPRIILSPTDTTWPFKLRRRQFPVRLCYAMTINKSQGQSLNRVGVYLPKPVFSHGQICRTVKSDIINRDKNNEHTS